MKLHVTPRTVANVLNRSGYFWKRVPKVTPLESKHIEARKAFVQKYGQKSVAWWRSHMSLIIDGVTLTKAPKGLSARQKHAAQSVGHMWMRQGERMSNDVHTFNRYGVQLGVKVPLWGGFTGNGVFALRLWTPTPKMSKPLWAARVPALRKAISEAGMPRPGESTSAFKVWQDNEGFLKQPDVYKQHGMRLVNFPPNSGDLSPIETVWARLRKDLAKREMVDLDNGVELSVLQFKQRAAQILASYSELGPKRHVQLPGQAGRRYAATPAEVQRQRVWALRQVTAKGPLASQCMQLDGCVLRQLQRCTENEHVCCRTTQGQVAIQCMHTRTRGVPVRCRPTASSIACEKKRPSLLQRTSTLLPRLARTQEHVRHAMHAHNDT